MAGNSKYLKGKLLLDGGNLRGSFFARTVVLICQHNAEGAFGLVLNRATGTNVGDAVVANLPEAFKSFPLFLGGPVQPGAFSYLHSDSFNPQTLAPGLDLTHEIDALETSSESLVIPNLSLGHDMDTLVQLGESFSEGQRIRMFAGYSGWAAGQLESEMERKAWLTHPASLELVFETDPVKLWRNILTKKGGKYRLMAQMPEDLSWN